MVNLGVLGVQDHFEVKENRKMKQFEDFMNH